ncbi:MAG: PEP-CTERM system TPR-repeat protein PrsT, partial [Comamonadaceae bacterium]|nr:PEP-CTERM system TPR-repeat protein PrsT [Comamonadaceae bacterium]
KSAAVDLKAALQKNAEATEARFLLGRVLLDSGDPSGALIELNKVRDAHFDDNRLLPVLAQAYFARGQFKTVFDQFEKAQLSDPKAAAEVKAYVGMAAFFGGDTERARAINDEALRLDPGNPTARVQQARLAAARGDFEAAIRIVDGVTASDPKLVPAWMLKGELMAGGKKDAEAAAQAFRRVVELDPRQSAAHEWLIRLAEQRGDAEAVKAQIAQLQKDMPNSWPAFYFGAQLALMNNDVTKANELAQQLLRVAPNSARGLQLAGQIELRSGATAQALKHLSQALTQSPQLPALRYQLGSAQLESGRPAETLRTLRPLLEAKQPGADALALAAQAYLQMGQLDPAMAYLKRASVADPKATHAQVMLALVEVVRGDAKSGLAALESLAAGDKGTTVDLVLTRVLVTRRDIDGALRASERMLAKAPDNALANLVRGQVLLLRDRRAEARTHFEKALSLNPAYFAAVTELAAIDIADRKIDAADNRYVEFLKHEPDNYRAQLELADLRERGGIKQSTIEPLLKDAVKANPDEPAPRLALIGYYTRQRKAEAALQAAQEAVAALPADLDLLAAFGAAQMAAGNPRQAVATFAKMAAQSATPEAYLQLARVHAGMKDYAAADGALRKALDIAPQSLAVQRDMIELALARKRTADALAVARDVERQRPRESTGYLMEAGIQAEQKAWPQAIAAAREAFARERSTSVAMRLHALYLAGGQPAEAEALAARWLQEHRDDAMFLFHLGSMALDRKDYAAAEARYREVLALRPGNA